MVLVMYTILNANVINIVHVIRHLKSNGLKYLAVASPRSGFDQVLILKKTFMWFWPILIKKVPIRF